MEQRPLSPRLSQTDSVHDQEPYSAEMMPLGTESVSPLTSSVSSSSSAKYAFFLGRGVNKGVKPVTPAHCRLGYSLNGTPPTRARRCRACVHFCGVTLLDRWQRCCSPRWLFLAAFSGAAVLTGGAVISMGILTNGLSAETLLPNVMAGAAASPTGIMVGLGSGLLLSTIGGCLWWCMASCHYLCRSAENQLLRNHKRAVQTYKNLMEQENLWGPLSTDKAGYKAYLEQYMGERAEQCLAILAKRQLGRAQMAEYGFLPDRKNQEYIVDR